MKARFLRCNASKTQSRSTQSRHLLIERSVEPILICCCCCCCHGAGESVDWGDLTRVVPVDRSLPRLVFLNPMFWYRKGSLLRARTCLRFASVSTSFEKMRKCGSTCNRCTTLGINQQQHNKAPWKLPQGDYKTRWKQLQSNPEKQVCIAIANHVSRTRVRKWLPPSQCCGVDCMGMSAGWPGLTMPIAC